MGGNLAVSPIRKKAGDANGTRAGSASQRFPAAAFPDAHSDIIATIAGVVLVAGAVGFLFQKLAVTKENDIKDLEPRVTELNSKADKFNRVYGQFQKAQAESDQITTWMEQRYYWGDVLAEMRRVLIRSEDDIKKKLSAQKPGVEAGIWIEQLTALSNPGATAMSPVNNGYGAPATPQPATDASANTNIIALVCRSVDLSKVSGDASAQTSG